MMRSLYSGVAGLKTHQTKMDVIGNNIANVNTVGFKASNVTFSDVLYQTTNTASAANEATGTTGINAKQIGIGTKVSSIATTVGTTGGSQNTDNALDCMINGDAFFIVNTGGTNYFTKAGSFFVDGTGTLCTASGASVMGWGVSEDGLDIVRDTVKPLTVGGIEATPELAKSGEYPLSRPFLFCYYDDKVTDAGKAFLDFAVSEDGQACVEDNHGIRVD